MNTHTVEYVWIDGFYNTRSKIKVIKNTKYTLELSDIPDWSFDGSSTGQAEGHYSDIIIKPVRLYSRISKFVMKLSTPQYYVLCETYNPDNTPHITNHRNELSKMDFSKDEPLFGMEQEYFIYDSNTDKPLKYDDKQNQGDFYCGVGGNVAFGRHIAELHLKKCIEYGIDICGINAEVAPAQWEFQIGICDPLKMGDDLWMARFLLNKIAEQDEYYINFHPKPLDKFNGSGCHTNFSTNKTRNKDSFNSLDELIKLCEKLKLTHNQHIKVYGIDNELRLTGKYETADINTFSYDVGNRGSSIRIPLQVWEAKCGYLEDRRPASNIDPYQVIHIICKTCLE